MQLVSEDDFKNEFWEFVWKLDSVSKIIGLLIVAKDNDYLVEITAKDW